MFLIKAKLRRFSRNQCFHKIGIQRLETTTVYISIYIHSLCPCAPPFPVSPVSDLCVFKEAFFLRYHEYHSPCQSPRSRFNLKAMVIRGCTLSWSFHSDPQSCSTCYYSVYESNYLIHSMNFKSYCEIEILYQFLHL